MGVTHDARDFFGGYERIEDELEIFDLADEEPALPQNTRQNKNRSRSKHLNIKDVCFVNSHKRTGIRQHRRTENLKFLLNLSEKDDELGENAEDVGLFETSLSPFGELLMEREKMKIWNDFINRSEDEQEQILMSHSFPQEEAVQESCSLVHNESWEEIPDKRDGALYHLTLSRCSGPDTFITADLLTTIYIHLLSAVAMMV